MLVSWRCGNSHNSWKQWSDRCMHSMRLSEARRPIPNALNQSSCQQHVMSLLKSKFCLKRKKTNQKDEVAPIISPRVSLANIQANSRSEPSFEASRFMIGRRVGKGQFSEVYEAIDKKKNERVALKKICIFEMMDAKTRLDCYKEINLLQQLDHPNVIKHLGYYMDGSDLYIVLELAGGGDLSKLIEYFSKQGKLIPEATIWKFFSQISDALKHMHEKRVMHRDIKPANVFITSDGIPKLGDLGLGRFFSVFTQDAHSLVGTPYYMSPERINETAYDFKSDIWSLGCLLYELAALQSPFYGEKLNLFALCKKIETCSYPPVPSDKYSQALRSLIDMCLNSVPHFRPDAAKVAEIARKQYLEHIETVVQQGSSSPAARPKNFSNTDLLTRC